MKKLSAILLTIIISITLSSCNNKTNESNQQYQDAMSNGKSSIVEEEYDKAIDYFDLALEAKKEAEEQAKKEAEAKKSSSSEESFTRADAKRILEREFGMKEYNESKDYDTTHESYFWLSDEPAYIGGKKCYNATLWNYVAEDDWWMHNVVYVSKDGIE